MKKLKFNPTKPKSNSTMTYFMKETLRKTLNPLSIKKNSQSNNLKFKLKTLKAL